MTNTEACRYFITYSGVSLPLRLVNEIQPTELDNRNTYFRGQFDAADRLQVLEKLVYGEVELVHRYRYDAEGRLTWAEITDADGEITVLEFD
jgi:uncharacterized protein DUF6156